MDWDEYKKICDRPNVLSRWMLEQTAAVCDSTTCGQLEAVRDTKPIARPADHRGGSAVDMFVTDFAPDQVREIIQHVAQAEANGVKTSGLLVRNYSGILKAWQEYQRSLSEDS